MAKKTFLLGLMLTVAATVRAIEIPLSGVTDSSAGGGGGGKIGFVDMDRIFQIYPDTKAAKEDYRKKLDKMKQDLAAKETEIGNVRDRIAVLDSTLKTIGAQTTPTPAPDGTTPPAEAGAPGNEAASLLNMKKDLETKQVEFEDAKKRAQEDLAAFERRQSQIILGKIYDALQELAQEEQVTMIVDKSSILYGATNIDLTDQLQEKVRGF